MAVSVTHAFVSPVADAGDPNEVGPNEWNDAHTIIGLGTAAEADSTDFATAAQGALADSALQAADIANMLETSDIGVSVQAHSAVLDATTASFTTAQETKLGHISVTQAVDLDAIETRVNALDAAVVLRGSWDASAGTFPGGGTAQAGDSYIVSVAGTVDSVAFVLNDRIIAITDNASTTTFTANWFKADYTDQVLSVAGKTGAVTLVAADLTDVTASAAELNYTDGVTSAIQTQLDAKQRLAVFDVRDYGALGDGVADDTAAILSAETARAAVGGELVFPPGTYMTDGTAINRANGGSWRGIGWACLKARANSTIICNLTGAVMTASAKWFRITGLMFDGNGFTGVRAVNENGPHMTQFDHCVIKQVQFAGAFIGANVVTQHGWIQVHDIIQYGAGSWAFYGYDNTKYLFHIEINNIHQIGTGVANWESQFWFEGRRAVGLSLTNVWSGSLDGDADGLLLRGDCQGVFVANATFVWPIVGIRALTWTDSLKPAYVYMTNVGVDQHTESGADIEGRTWYLANCNFANGYVRTNTGSGFLLQSTSTDIALSNCLFAYDQRSGLVIEAGAAKVRVNGCTLENNNQVAGAFYDLDLGASTYKDVVLYGANFIAGSVNATGQRVVNGVTSKEVSRNTGSASTTAVTTQEDLMTYSIPANTLKPGQKVRLTAWGTFAANANVKTPRLWFGANSVMDWGGAHNNVPWKLTSEIVITGVDAQEYHSVGFVSAAAAVVRQGTATNDDGSAIVVKCTGQNNTASAGDITCQGFTVEILD